MKHGEHHTHVVTDAAERREIARQASVEIAISLIIEQSLRIALQWAKRDPANSHTISTLRYHTWSFERHLARVQSLADHGGYLHLITDASPHLDADVRFLENEREELYAELASITVRLENAPHNNNALVESICEDLEHILDNLRTHGQKETELLQHSFTQEEGGSG